MKIVPRLFFQYLTALLLFALPVAAQSGGEDAYAIFFSTARLYTVDSAISLHNEALQDYQDAKYLDAIRKWTDILYTYYYNGEKNNLSIALLNIALAYDYLKDDYKSLLYSRLAYQATEYSNLEQFKKVANDFSQRLIKHSFMNRALDVYRAMLEAGTQGGDSIYIADMTMYIDDLEKVIRKSDSLQQKYEEFARANKNSTADLNLAAIITRADFALYKDSTDLCGRLLREAANNPALTQNDSIFLAYINVVNNLYLYDNLFQTMGLGYPEGNNTINEYWPIVTMKDFGKDSLLVYISGGTADGIKVGAKAHIVGSYYSDLKEHGSYYLAKGEIVGVEEKYARGIFVISNPDKPNKIPYTTDQVEVEVNSPVKDDGSYWAAFNRLNINFLTKDGTILNQRYLLKYLATPAIKQKLLSIIAKDYKATIAEVKDYLKSDTDFTKKMSLTVFTGKSIIEIMEQATEDDVENFFQFVQEYPARYTGRFYKANETFATWLQNGALLGAERVKKILVNAKTDEDLKKFAEQYKADLLENNQLKAVINSVKEAENNTEYPTALPLALKALKVAEYIESKPDMASIQFNLGLMYDDIKMFIPARDAYNKAIYYHTILGNKLSIAEAYHNQALNYQHADLLKESVAFFDSSINRKKELLKTNRTNDMLETLASSYWGQAWCLRYLEKYKDALDVYSLSAAYYDSSGTASALVSKLTVTKNVGEIYEATGNYKKGVEVYSSLIPLAISVKDSTQLGKLYNAVGHAYFQLGDYTKSIEFYSTGYNVLIAINNKREAAYSQSNMGQAQWNLGNFTKGIEHHTNAIRLRTEVNDRSGLAYSYNKLAGLYKEAGDPQKALEGYTKSAAIYKELNDTSGSADVYESLGGLYKEIKDYEKSLENYFKALENRKALKQTIPLADCYSSIGSAYYDYMKYDKALANYEEAYKLQLQVGDKANLIYSLCNIANINVFFSRKFTEAENLYTQALTTAREVDSKSIIAFCYSRLGGLFKERGELDRAKQFMDSALTLYRTIGEQQRVAGTLVDIGYIHISKGKFKIAEELFTEAMQISRKINNRTYIAISYSSLGDLYELIGEYKKAKEQYDSTMVIYKEVNNVWGIASSNISMGNLYNHLGEFKLSVDYYQLADSIYAALNDEYSRATPLNNIGTIYYWTGDNEQALPQFKNVLSILDKYQPSGEFYGIVVSNIGEVLFDMGQHQEALPWLMRAKAIAEKSDARRNLITTLGIIGKLYLATEKYDSALYYFNKAYSEVIQTGEKTNIADLSGYLGKAYLKTKDLKKALEYLDVAISTCKTTGLTRYLHQPLFSKALLLRDQGNIDGSITYLREAIDVLEYIRSKVVGEKAQKKFSSGKDKAAVYENIISLYIQKNQIDSALYYLDRSNNEALKQQFGKLDVNLKDENKNQALQQEKELKTKVDGIKDELAKEKAKPETQQNKEKIQSLENNVKVAEQEYIGFVNETVKKYKDLAKYFSSVNPRNFVRSKGNIPDDVAVLAYLMGENQLYIFAATREDVFARVIPVSKDVLEKKVVKLYRYIKDAVIPAATGDINPATFTPVKEGAEGSDKLKQVATLSAELYSYLIAPIKQEIKNKKHLSIIPFGKLFYLPFETLAETNADGSFKAFLGNEYTVFYTSALDAVFKNDDPKDVLRILALGNADNSLPNAEKEVNDIKTIMKDSKIYLRNDATKDRVRDETLKYNAIHFATHGNLDYEQIENSYLTLASKSANPDSTRLTISEIWSLTNLNGYSLVTLSACKTAVSEEVVTGWMVNPANAFFDVGVKSVVASLWQVDDEATGILMQEFYKNIGTMNKSDALQKAKESLSKNPKYAFPFYWAPFVLVGDYR